MRNNRISLQDIASLAGVSKMTVSRYLRDSRKVASDTRIKIAEILDEMNYVPSRAPNMMASAKSNSIGVLIPSFQNQVFSDILSGLEFVTNQHGYQLLISEYNYSREKEEKQILNLLSYDIEGLVLCEKNHTLRAQSYLRSQKIPVIEIMDTLDSQLDIEIGFDNKLAAYHMVNMMITSGKRNIYYFGSRNDQRDNQRYMGYRTAMQEYNLPPRRMTPNSISSFSLGATMLKVVLREERKPDGIFCTNDDIAVGALQECLRLGIRVPQDMAIAGFHGLDIGKAVTPTLASVITPRFEIGKKSAEVIINKMNGTHHIKSFDLGFKIFSGETI
ncbi:substrate-binding domain-containing protein [Enterobacter sp. R1(2018)]|uniref:DNA-binding transcriptional regulator IdnR n=1 Tax=Enterobacter sp. R1(2018) TaxID=2447891 RepID=UPI000EB0692E|nr:substrate-binding domain-containing protein [Enterobacter sp. R1(2018)]RKQ41561.1 LacI family DNA-binding transcriptional regulator [Enterobacter sp. R1(2018)]